MSAAVNTTKLPKRLEDGQPTPLGARWDGEGVNFALFSAHAERVELCVFDDDGTHEIARLELSACSNQIWHGYLPGAGPHTVYGYRVHGPYQPHLGHRFNPAKLLLDPYCRQLKGHFLTSDLHQADARDNQHLMPKCIVTAPLEELRRNKPAIPLSRTVLYEAHLKGFTFRHPGIPDAMRGKFAGMASDQIISYLKSLGITSVELLPIQSFISEPFLKTRQLSNYWGYNPLCLFAPHQDYLGSDGLQGLRNMVARFHDAGIELILDVVFNHTAEGGRLGPTLSFRGIDNASYYRLQSEDRSFYINDTGCGNTLNMGHPRVIQLVMDCLRYWAEELQFDGFRFDLAPVLGRQHHGFSQDSAFFVSLLQDPALAGVKLIAEPWDIGPDGYQLGNFPPDWSEWNDRYRDATRRFWRGDPGVLPDFARRLHGSSDIFEHAGRRPSASINYVCSHDGFTLHDLVSYRDRHNEDNKEGNLDGHRENLSDNFGVEGPSDDPTVQCLRLRQQRNFLLTLFMSQGVPMLQAGDEFCRTLHGNNNAYCQDNSLNWIDWEGMSDEAVHQQQFTRYLIALRGEHQLLFPDFYIHDADYASQHSILWFNSDGEAMQSMHWQEHHSTSLGYMISARHAPAQPLLSLLVIVHADRSDGHFTLPPNGAGEDWTLLLDSADWPRLREQPVQYSAGATLALTACSALVLISGSRATFDTQGETANGKS